MNARVSAFLVMTARDGFNVQLEIFSKHIRGIAIRHAAPFTRWIIMKRTRNDARLLEQAAFRWRLICATRLVCHARNSQDQDESSSIEASPRLAAISPSRMDSRATYPADVNMDEPRCAGFPAPFPSRISWGQQGETLLLWRSMGLSGEYLKAVLLHWLTVSVIRECPCSIRRHASLLVLTRFPGKTVTLAWKSVCPAVFSVLSPVMRM